MLTLGYEKIDNTGKGWNFNGRADPTQRLLTKEFYDSLDPWGQTVYNFAIDPKDDPMFLNPFNYCNIPKINVNNLNNIRYVYPIFIGNIHLYLKLTSHVGLSLKVVDDVKKGYCKIVFILDAEGDAFNRIHELDSLIKKLELPKKQIYFIHGDYATDKYNDFSFMYRTCDPFPFWLKDKINLQAQPNFTKLFLTYNRAARIHRTLLMLLLTQNNLLESGIFSFGTIVNSKPLFNSRLMAASESLSNKDLNTLFSDQEWEQLKKLQNTSLDYDDLINSSLHAINVNISDYDSTFVSLVTETLYDKNVLFLSEKIYKPILTGHPFIVLGNPGTLTLLQKKGYKTFNQFWDELYDNEHDLYKRTNMIMDIVKKLNSKSFSELQDLRSMMQDILNHNRNLFLSEINKGNYPLLKAVTRIYYE